MKCRYIQVHRETKAPAEDNYPKISNGANKNLNSVCKENNGAKKLASPHE